MAFSGRLLASVVFAAPLLTFSNLGFAATVANPLCPQNTAFFNPDHGQDINLPSGFKISVFASGLNAPTGIAFRGDADNFEDLVNFWNIRAAGAGLVFYDPHHATRLAPLLESHRRWLASVPVLAQHDVGSGVLLTPLKPLEQTMREEMGCTCGTCEHEPLTRCTCGEAERMRAELRGQIDQGKNRDEIIANFMALYGGQQFLSSPLNQGFARLA